MKYMNGWVLFLPISMAAASSALRVDSSNLADYSLNPKGGYLDVQLTLKSGEIITITGESDDPKTIRALDVRLDQVKTGMIQIHPGGAGGCAREIALVDPAFNQISFEEQAVACP